MPDIDMKSLLEILDSRQTNKKRQESISNFAKDIALELTTITAIDFKVKSATVREGNNPRRRKNQDYSSITVDIAVVSVQYEFIVTVLLYDHASDTPVSLLDISPNTNKLSELKMPITSTATNIVNKLLAFISPQEIVKHKILQE